jgi:hypothetical protein
MPDDERGDPPFLKIVFEKKNHQEKIQIFHKTGIWTMAKTNFRPFGHFVLFRANRPQTLLPVF